MDKDNTGEVRIKRVIYSLFLFEGVLIFLNILDYLLGMPFWPITKLIYVGFESNIPAWFSSMQLFVIGAIALLNFYQEKSNKEKVRLSFKRGWLWVSFIFMYLSVDEASEIHETVGRAIEKYGISFKALDMNGVWTLAFAPFGIAVAVYLIIFFFQRFNENKRGLILFIIGLILMGFSVFLEFIQNFLNNAVLEKFECFLEEGLEMTGATFILWALSLYALFLFIRNNKCFELER